MAHIPNTVDYPDSIVNCAVKLFEADQGRGILEKPTPNRYRDIHAVQQCVNLPSVRRLAMMPSFRRSALASLVFVALLWLFELLDRAFELQLFRFGVYPHSLDGLAGVLLAPLIHGSWSHLLSNSFALLILLTALLYGYPRSARPALLLIYLGSGLGVWLFARENYHFGASGLTHGMMFYVFTSGILRRDRRSIALSLIVFFIYGSMIWSIFPQEPGISYESHFFGALFGVLAALLFARRDPPPAEKHYDWEDEEEPDEAGEKQY